jgi:hypothetical protein
VPAQFAREELQRRGPLQPAVELSKEPSTRGERPSARPRASQDDLGLLLDDAIPSLDGLPVVQGSDPDDEVNTSSLGPREVAAVIARVEAAQRDQDKTDPRTGRPVRPVFLAALVFVVVLAAGLGALALYRGRLIPADPSEGPRPKVTRVEPPPRPSAALTEPAPASDDGPTPAAIESAAGEGGESGEGAESDGETVTVRFDTVAGTHIVDQRDESALTPNTPYRWRPGHRTVVYSCPVKPKHGRVNVTYNFDVLPAPQEQSFKISCK